MFERFSEGARQVLVDAQDEARELRHTFVSVLSDDGMPIEQISQLAGHSETATTETVYRHQIRPVIQTGAVVMDQLFGLPATSSARTDSPSVSPSVADEALPDEPGEGP